MTDEQLEALKRRAEDARAKAPPDVGGQAGILVKADDVLWLLGKAGKGDPPAPPPPPLHETAAPPPQQQEGKRPQRKAGEP